MSNNENFTFDSQKTTNDNAQFVSLSIASDVVRPLPAVICFSFKTFS